MAAQVQVTLDQPMAEVFAAVGILANSKEIPPQLRLFVEQCDQAMEKVREMRGHDEMSAEQAAEFQQLLVDTAARVLCHPIVASNNYLERFSRGVTLAQARHELQQFSVFALQFDVAQAKLVANAPTLEAYHERLNVLLNEKGIPYQEGFEGELTGRWSPDTVHFSWLQRMAEDLGLPFEELGKSWLGNSGTMAFVDTTFRCYGSRDQNTALGASFGIENWAANNLWKPWIAGMRKFMQSAGRQYHIGYLTYHEAEEEHHAQATIDELLETFMEPWFDANAFLAGAEAVLTEGVQAYYESQLATVPEKDATWPARAWEPRKIDPARLPRVASALAHA